MSADPATYPVSIDVDDLLALSIALAAATQEYRKTITLGTKEQWDAWQCLMDAVRYLFSAANWLSAHQEKMEARNADI